MEQPVATIFTLAYNAQAYIAETIESVLKQTEHNIEYVIRDNGSTDKTYSIIKKYAEKDKRIRIVRNKKNHLNNDGTVLEFYQYCPEPQGKYFAMLDSDDLLEPDFVKTLSGEAEKHGADMVVAGTTMFADGSGRVMGVRQPPYLVYHGGDALTSNTYILLYGNLRPIWGKLYRTDFFEKYKRLALKIGYKLLAGGDTSFVFTFMRQADCVVSVPKSLHRYRLKPSGHYSCEKPDPRRIADGEYLFYQTQADLERYKVKNGETITFLYQVFLQHLLDLIAMVKATSQMDIAEGLNFFEKITQSPLLHTAKDYQYVCPKAQLDYTTVFRKILDYVSNITIEQKLLINSYLLKICAAQKDLPNSVRELMLFLGIYSENNHFHFGQELLAESESSDWGQQLAQEKNMEMLINCPAFLRDFMHEHTFLIANSEKVKTLDAIERQDWEQAKQSNHFVLDVNPIDREGLYFGLYIAAQCENHDEAEVLLYLSSLFWDTDEDMQDLMQQVRKQGER